MRRLIVHIAILAVGALIAWALSLGMDLSHALLAGAIVVVIAEFGRTAGPLAHPVFPSAPHPLRAGARRDVSDLTWSAFRGDGRMSDHVMRRVRGLAERRLRDRGVDPADPGQADRVAAVLGADLADGLASPVPPHPAQLDRWLQRLEDLGHADPSDEARLAANRQAAVTATPNPVAVTANREDPR